MGTPLSCGARVLPSARLSSLGHFLLALAVIHDESPAPHCEASARCNQADLAARLRHGFLTMPVVMSGCLMWRRGGGLESLSPINVSHRWDSPRWKPAIGVKPNSAYRCTCQVADDPYPAPPGRDSLPTRRAGRGLEHMIGAAAAPQDAAIAVRTTNCCSGLAAGHRPPSSRPRGELEASRATPGLARTDRAALGKPERSG